MKNNNVKFASGMAGIVVLACGLGWGVVTAMQPAADVAVKPAPAVTVTAPHYSPAPSIYHSATASPVVSSSPPAAAPQPAHAQAPVAAPPVTAPPVAAQTSAPSCGCGEPVAGGAAAYDPWTVVSEYYGDMDADAYSEAWNMQGPSFQAANGGYDHWVAGYANTSSQSVSEVSESGGTVYVYLSAVNSGVSQVFNCEYVVDTLSGLITSGSCQAG
jgi:hypothetical protein